MKRYLMSPSFRFFFLAGLGHPHEPSRHIHFDWFSRFGLLAFFAVMVYFNGNHYCVWFAPFPLFLVSNFSSALPHLPADCITVPFLFPGRCSVAPTSSEKSPIPAGKGLFSFFPIEVNLLRGRCLPTLPFTVEFRRLFSPPGFERAWLWFVDPTVLHLPPGVGTTFRMLLFFFPNASDGPLRFCSLFRCCLPMSTHVHGFLDGHASS